MEDPQEVQEREIEVLQGELPFVASHIIENDVLTSVAQLAAIYGEDFEKAETRTAWKVRSLST